MQPARIDSHSGYRYYDIGQLARLNRIVALKDLGFGLEQVRELLDEDVDVEALRGMLTLRRAELQATIATDAARLRRVEARLHSIESEDAMPANDVVLKDIPAVTVAELTGTAASFQPEDIGPVVRPLCEQLGKRLADAELTATGNLVCYCDKSSQEGVTVHAAVPVSGSGDTAGLTLTELPATRAATTVHRGSMDGVLPAWQAVARWVDANGYHTSAPSRELYLETSDDEDEWVTELQEPIG